MFKRLKPLVHISHYKEIYQKHIFNRNLTSHLQYVPPIYFKMNGWLSFSWVFLRLFELLLFLFFSRTSSPFSSEFGRSLSKFLVLPWLREWRQWVSRTSPFFFLRFPTSSFLLWGSGRSFGRRRSRGWAEKTATEYSIESAFGNRCEQRMGKLLKKHRGEWSRWWRPMSPQPSASN